MPLKLDEYILSAVGDKALCYIESLADKQGVAPYMAIVNDVAVIGPLMVHIHPDGRFFSIHSETGQVSSDFGKLDGKELQELFEFECGSMRTGTYMMLWNMRAQNFWHWTMETLPKVLMAEAAGFDGYFIIPPLLKNTKFIIESMDMFGISPHRMITYDGKPWRLERLYLPQSIDGFHDIGLFPELLDRLRSRFLNAITPLPSSPKRLYIARDDLITTRRISNEIDVLDVLFKYGFQRIVMERYCLSDQIRLSAAADCLVGPHGAGMVHCLFCKPESIVVEMFNPNYVNPTMLAVVDHYKHRYFMIPSPGIDPKPTKDIKVNIQALNVTLKRELEHAKH